MPELFVDVALALPTATQSFQYSVPEGLQAKIQPGKRVWVSVRSRKIVGYILSAGDSPLFDQVKPIDAVIDEAVILNDTFLKLTQWMSEYYCCALGQCIETVMPAAFKKGKFFMKSRSGPPEAPEELVNPKDLPLTSDQRRAFEIISEKILAREQGAYLLHGVTGSGKTEVYMHLIREVLQQNRSAIVLVPEISLTPQTVERFVSRFGDGVAVIHSRLTQARRVEEWHRIRNGQARVVVGPRSAVFSPAQNLGLIIIDEEHDTSYKQEETPRYETRRVAAKRAELEGAVLLMGSATPSLESYYAANQGKIIKIELPKRIENRPLPEVEILDMRREGSQKGEKIFSKKLEDCVRESLNKKEQVMLLLNRRGFSTYVHCSHCGYVMTCPNCRISLTYHFEGAQVVCHVCHYHGDSQKLCPSCQKAKLHYFGIGTQKVEAEAKHLFRDAKIMRMDSDSTTCKGAHEYILKSFRKKEIDILIGTQMIAKGHDFPNVSLIGVVSADTALHIPDFRAAERTFNLLTQVAGRAGRGDILGKVIVQTSVPHHYSIVSAKHHDYHEFYEKEIEFRRELAMPPFGELIQIILTGANEKELFRQIKELAHLLELQLDKATMKLMGPAPCLVSKENGRFCWNFYLRGPSVEQMLPILRKTLADFKRRSTQLVIDVNPQ